MKKRHTVQPDLDTIIPILIHAWRKFRKEPGPPDRLQTREFRRTVDAVKKLQEMHDGKESLIGKDYLEDSDILGGYLLYHWPLHYQQALSLIGELPEPPRRVLDICSGPLPMAFAAMRHGAKEVFATDRNLRAMEVGAQICGRYGYPVTIRRWKCPNGKLPVEGEFDLIILGHCLEELFPSTIKGSAEKQQDFVRSLIEKLSPDGYLLVVDSSYTPANHKILDLRDRLVKEGVPIQAPCIWKGDCPALKQDKSPCYAQREMEKPYLMKELQRAAQIQLNSLKMSYIIFRNPKAGWPIIGDRNLYRIISPPVETYQGKRFYLCGTDGKKNLGCRLSETPPEARAFDYLKRGELIELKNPLDKLNSLDIIEGTSVTAVAACGKPLRISVDNE